jgi:hypothetical protein
MNSPAQAFGTNDCSAFMAAAFLTSSTGRESATDTLVLNDVDAKTFSDNMLRHIFDSILAGRMLFDNPVVQGLRFS